MIRRIVAFALYQPLFIVLGVMLFIGAGLWAFNTLPVEAFPDVTDTQATVIALYPGRAAEEVVFGRVTTGAANDLERVTEIARSMVFEWGMAEGVASRTMRADNYALSEETKRLRDSEQARFTDTAYEDALRLLKKHRATLDKIAVLLLEKETLGRDEVLELFADVEPESRAADSVGVPRVVAAKSVDLGV